MFLLMMIASVSGAYAQKLSMADFYIEAGATAEVTLNLEQGGIAVKAFQCSFNLPAGLTMAKPKAVAGTMTDDDEEPTKPSVAFNDESNTVAVYHGEGYSFNSDAKAVLKITFTADDSFSGGTVSIRDISISDNNNDGHSCEDVAVKVTSNNAPPTPTTYAINVVAAQNGSVRVDKSEAAEGETIKVTAVPAQGYELDAVTVKSGSRVIALSSDFTFVMPAAAVTVSATFKKIEVPTPTGQPTLSMSDFSIEAGGTATVNLNLVQDNVTVKAFQCAFELPAGLTMAKPKAVAGTMTDEDEEPTKPSVAFNEDGNTVAVYSGEGYPFNADATKVLTITFTADATFQGGTVTIKDISISDENNDGYNANNISVKVTSSYVAPTPTTYAISVASVQNGVLTVDKSEAEAGETVKVTATPAEGYELEAISVTANGTSIALSADNTFTMPAAAVIVSATFKKIYVPTPTGQPTLSMSDFSIEAGGTATVNLNLVQDNVTVKAFQCAFELPVGLTMAKPKAVNGTMTDEEDEPTKPSVAFNEDGNTVAVYSGEGYPFNADATKVLTITFTADATFQGGTVTIKGISISDADNNAIESANVSVKVTSSYVAPTTYAISIVNVQNGVLTVDKSEAEAGETVKVTATPAEGYELETISVTANGTSIALSADNTFTMPAAAVIVSATFKKIYVPTPTGQPTLSMSDFSIEAGGTATVNLNLVQDNVTVKAFQCAFELPAGLTMAKPKAVAGTMTDEEDEPTKPSVAFNEDGNTVAVYSGEGYPFNADATKVLTITFTADATFQGGTVTIKGISISDADNNGIEAADVKVNVTSNYVAPTTYAISVTNVQNGVLTVDKSEAEAGETVKVTATPAEGYELEAISVTANGTSIALSADNTFTMPAAAVTVSATFKKIYVPTPTGQPTLSMSDFTIEAGGTATVALNLVQDNVRIKAFQCAFELPAGLSMYRIRAYDTMTDEDNEPTKPSVAFNSENKSIAVYSVEGYLFNADATKVLSITFIADATFQGGTVSIKDISISDENNNAIEAADVSVKVTAEGTIPPTPTDKPTLSMSDFTIEAGGTADVYLDLIQNNVTVKAFQCAFELPAGLTMAKPKAVNGTMTDEDSEPTKPSVAFNEDGNTVAVYSGEGYAFNADATSILKITFTADANFQGGNIIIKGISISDKDNYGYSCEDVVTTVTLEAVVPVHEFTYQEYLLYNVGAEMFLGAANNWGTQASFVQHPEFVRLEPQADSNVYHLESQVNNGGNQYYLGDNGYMDTSTPADLIITRLANGNYTIVTSDGEYLGYDGINTILVTGIDGNDVNAQWIITSLVDAKADLMNATEEAPMDATFLIMDPNFGRNNRFRDSWTMDAANQNLSGGEVSNFCAESWHSDFVLSQTLTDIPAGLYALTAQGFYRQDGDNNVNLPVFYANDATATFPVKDGAENSMVDASYSFSEGLYTIDPIYVKVEEGGSLTIGAKLEGNTALWCIWDNFVLTYFGPDAEPIIPEPTGLFIDRTEEYLAVNDDTQYSSIELGHTEENGTHEYGALVTEGNGSIFTSDFWFYADPNIEWDRRGADVRNSAAFINNVDMSADKVSSNLWITDGKWTFLSFPYDVKVKDIMPEDAATQWVIRKYDGQLRADGEMDKTWVNMNPDDVLEAYQGYIWQSAGEDYSGFTVPAMNNANKYNIFAKDDVAVSLAEYQSEFAHNRSWNMVGNPYPSYFNIRYMDFEAPVTTWNVNTQSYEAYSPLDDEYVFYPYEAFFVQRPEAGYGEIIFDKNGRQTTLELLENGANAPAFIRAQSDVKRDVLNLMLSDGELADRTRIVVNEAASYDYELDKDASKFMSANSLAPQFFTIGNDIQYAINERPLSDGIVQLGATLVKTGKYTIALQTNAEVEVTLEDRTTGVKVRLDQVEGYTFEAEAGQVEKRFILYVKKPTGIKETTMPIADSDIFTVDGRRVQNMNARGIYIVKKGSQVVKQRVK